MVLGIIGGVGAGKSTVLKFLEAHCGFHIIETDKLAKQLYEPQLPAALAQAGVKSLHGALGALFGPEVYGADGYVDYRLMAERMYRDAGLRLRLEALVHPAVWAAARALAAHADGRRLCLETALPAPEFAQLCDEIWYIHCERQLRIERLMRERGYSAARAEAILRAQPSEADYRQYADVVFDNSGSQKELLDEIYQHCKRKQW